MKGRTFAVCTLLMTAFFLGIAYGAVPGIDGKWKFVLDTPDGSRTSQAEFKLEGETVTGKWDKSDVKGTFVDGKLDLTFHLVVEEHNMEGDLAITAKLDGEKLTGEWSFLEYSGTLVATPASLPGLDGKWLFILATPDGERRVPADLKLEGDAVTGQWGGFEVKGTSSEGKLDLKFYIKAEAEDMEGDIALTGKLDGEKIVGEWVFTEYSGTFEATRGQ